MKRRSSMASIASSNSIESNVNKTIVKKQTKKGALSNEVASLKNQVSALRDAFSTLSDVLVEEIDEIRRDNEARYNIIKRELSDIRNEFHLEAREGRLLRASHAHVAEWVNQCRSEVISLRTTMHTLEETVTTSNTALSSDVSALADDAATIRTRNHSQNEIIQGKINSLTESLEKQRTADTKSLQARLSALEASSYDVQDRWRQSVTQFHKSQITWKSSLEEKLQQISQQSRTDHIESKRVCDDVVLQSDELQRVMREQNSEARRQYEATSHAIRAFADVLNVSPPISSS